MSTQSLRVPFKTVLQVLETLEFSSQILQPICRTYTFFFPKSVFLREDYNTNVYLLGSEEWMTGVCLEIELSHTSWDVHRFVKEALHGMRKSQVEKWGWVKKMKELRSTNW